MKSKLFELVKNGILWGKFFLFFSAWSRQDLVSSVPKPQIFHRHFQDSVSVTIEDVLITVMVVVGHASLFYFWMRGIGVVKSWYTGMFQSWPWTFATVFLQVRRKTFTPPPQPYLKIFVDMFIHSPFDWNIDWNMTERGNAFSITWMKSEATVISQFSI